MMKLPTSLKIAGSMLYTTTAKLVSTYEFPILWSVVFVMAASIGCPIWFLAIVGAYTGINWIYTFVNQYKEVKELASSMSITNLINPISRKTPIEDSDEEVSKSTKAPKVRVVAAPC